MSAAVVALPLGLAFGVASGAGPMAGVYSAILVGLFASIFGGTPAQLSGPTGPMTVVMTAVLTAHVASDPTNGMANAFVVVILAGLFQMMFGFLKLGKYIVQVPYPVISGFMSGIGVIIILLQIAPMLGGSLNGEPVEVLEQLPALVEQISVPTFALGSGLVLLLFVWRGRWNEWVPGPVLALVVGTSLVWLVPTLDDVSILGPIPSGFLSPGLPDLDPTKLVSEVGSALLLAALGAIDSLLTSLVADNLTNEQHRSDKELIGQGVGNLVAGLFGALPGAGATVRTVVNIKAGGVTAWSGVTHALLVAAIVLIAGPVASHIPHVVLAAILTKVGVDIIDRRFLTKIHRVPPFSASLMLLVLGLTVFVDLITAVFIGVFISNMVTVERLTNIQLDNVRLFGDLDQKFASQGRVTMFPQPIVLELRGPMSFGVARGLNRRLAEHSIGHQTLVIDLTHATLLGVTTALTLLDVIEDEQRKGRQVLIIGANSEAIQHSFERIGIFDLVLPEHRFASIEQIGKQKESNT